MPETTPADTPEIARHFGKILAISPHLDDAVFACGALLATCSPAVVLTVFAGEPAHDVAVTPWDASCGFSSAQQAMRSRRHEDLWAMRVLNAQPIHLAFLDAQYNRPPDPLELQLAIRTAVEREQPDTVLFPLGLFHSDHVLVHAAVMAVRGNDPGVRWVAYEDALYRRKPGLLQERLDALKSQKIQLTFMAFCNPLQAGRKARAVAAYASQLDALGLVRSEQDNIDSASGAQTSTSGSSALWGSSASPDRSNGDHSRSLHGHTPAGHARGPLAAARKLRADGDTAAPEGYWLLH